MRRSFQRRREFGAFKLRDAGFGGRGLQPEAGDGSWVAIRDLVYLCKEHGVRELWSADREFSRLAEILVDGSAFKLARDE